MMNKRIRELEKQSVFYNEDIDNWELDHLKFAELIIRECAAYAFSDDQDHKAMLNHFGVKE